MKKNVREHKSRGVRYAYILDELLYPNRNMSDREKVAEFLADAWRVKDYEARRYGFISAYADYIMGLPTEVAYIYYTDAQIEQVEQWMGRKYTRECDREHIRYNYPKVIIKLILQLANEFNISARGESEDIDIKGAWNYEEL